MAITQIKIIIQIKIEFIKNNKTLVVLTVHVYTWCYVNNTI